MCLVDTDAPAVAKFVYSHKQKQKTFYKQGQSLWKPDMAHFETWVWHFDVKQCVEVS